MASAFSRSGQPSRRIPHEPAPILAAADYLCRAIPEKSRNGPSVALLTWANLIACTWLHDSYRHPDLWHLPGRGRQMDRPQRQQHQAERLGGVHRVRRDGAAMSDAITCPKCEGESSQRLGQLRIACRFCHGRGWVSAEHEPAEPPPPPTSRPRLGAPHLVRLRRGLSEMPLLPGIADGGAPGCKHPHAGNDALPMPDVRGPAGERVENRGVHG